MVQAHWARGLRGGVGLFCLSLVACSGSKPDTAWSGYAEGDYVYVAQAGQKLRKGDLLFTLEAEAERAARDEAAARLATAQAQARNLDKGRRQEEIAVAESQLAQAQAHATLMRADLARQQQLVVQGFVSKARTEDSLSALNEAQAKVAELTASLRVARLPARPDERAASHSSVSAAGEVLRQTQWREAQKKQIAPSDAVVADLYFRQGEFVPAGQPVLSLLPPQNIKARFFVPEADIGQMQPGMAVALHCDGCVAPIAAKVTRIATQAEYTPPVIYSNAQRSKLVFMVEARPDPVDAVKLHPGQPLDVRAAP